MKQICQGRKTKDQVIQEVLRIYRDAFQIAKDQINVLYEFCGKYMTEIPSSEQIAPVRDIGVFVRHCILCFCSMYLRQLKPEEARKVISCSGYPSCKEAIWISEIFTGVEVMTSTCNFCSRLPEKPVHLLKVEFKRGALPHTYESPVFIFNSAYYMHMV